MELKEKQDSPQRTRAVVYAGLFLALAVLWQSLRFFVPWLTGPWSVFLIGSLVKATLVLALLVTGRGTVAGIALLLPLVAFLQGQLPLLPLVPVVGAGSALYALLAWHWWGRKGIWLAPCVAGAVFYAGTRLVLFLFSVSGPLAGALTLMMSWPQLVTGYAGIFLAGMIYKRLSRRSDL